MNIEHQKITLELNSVSSYETLEAHRGDKNSRYIDCTITSNGVLQSLQNLTAIIDATVNDVIVADGNSVAIDNDIAIIELTENMLSLPGRMKIDLKLSDDNSLITTQTFYVRVGNSVINETSKFEPTGGSIDERITTATDTANEAKEQSQSNTANIEKLKNEKINTYQLGTVTDLAELPVFIKNSIYYGLCKGFGSVFGLSDTIEIGFMVTTIPRSSSTKDYAMWFLANGTIFVETISTKDFVRISYGVDDVNALLDLKLSNVAGAVKTENLALAAVGTQQLQSACVGYDELQEGCVSEDILSADVKDTLYYSDYVDITDTLATEHCYYIPSGEGAGKKKEYANGLSAYFKTSPGRQYKVSGRSLYNVALAIFFKSDGSYMSTYGLSSGTTYTDEPITIPEGCGYVAFQSHITGTLIVKEFKILSTVKEALSSEIEHTKDYVNPLRNKSMYVDGDSIAFGQGSNGYSYSDFIKDTNNMQMTKSAVSGTSLAVREGRSDSICERINALTGNYDYILIEGGINDMFLSLPLGTLSDSYEGGYDTSTAVGALESIGYKLVTEFFTSKKLFILAHKKINYPSQSTYWDAYKATLKKWGIHYVDVSEQTNLCAYNDTIANKWFANGDGTHPLKTAYELFYVPLITSKLKEL